MSEKQLNKLSGDSKKKIRKPLIIVMVITVAIMILWGFFSPYIINAYVKSNVSKIEELAKSENFDFEITKDSLDKVRPFIGLIKNANDYPKVQMNLNFGDKAHISIISTISSDFADEVLIMYSPEAEGVSVQEYEGVIKKIGDVYGIKDLSVDDMYEFGDNKLGFVSKSGLSDVFSGIFGTLIVILFICIIIFSFTQPSRFNPSVIMTRDEKGNLH